MDKKKLARREMLRKLSKGRSEESEMGLGEALKNKKLSKVEVISDSKEGLNKGLTKAQEILKAKLGDQVLTDDDVDESEDNSMHDEDCDECHGEGCEHCVDEE